MKKNPEKIIMKCKKCKHEMGYEHNVFTLYYFCENPKCKAYLLRECPREKDFFGRIEIEKKDLWVEEK